MIFKWFDKWFEKQCKKAWENSRLDDDEDDCDSDVVSKKKARRGTNRMSKVDEDILQDRQCYTLKMQPATGGTILQVSHYNAITDEWHSDMFVVDENKDLGEEFTSILVQYRLKHS